jgi:hypothetical protein
LILDPGLWTMLQTTKSLCTIRIPAPRHISCVSVLTSPCTVTAELRVSRD